MMNATLSHLIGVRFQKEDFSRVLISPTAVAGGLQAIRWGMLPLISRKVGQVLDRSDRKHLVLVLFMAFNSVMLLIIPSNISYIIWFTVLLLHLVISSCTTNIIDTLYSNLSSRGENRVLLNNFVHHCRRFRCHTWAISWIWVRGCIRFYKCVFDMFFYMSITYSKMVG
ncbi:hypothetical protein [Robertmurraya sp. FSL R5-0851]|uniref:hypothetical protein n=1 Tax=Robertmurraya sp. FSL R5-0851 TaxID=2921584 RepID=UPI0013707646